MFYVFVLHVIVFQDLVNQFQCDRQIRVAVLSIEAASFVSSLLYYY